MLHSAGVTLTPNGTPSPVATRLLAHVAGDRLFRASLGSGYLRLNGNRVFPSGLDAAACMVARTLIGDDVPAVAVAFPRGRGPHPAMLGLALALWRHGLPGQLSGSVLVSTARGDVSKQLRNMTFDGAEFAELAAGRLVTEKVPGSGGLDFNGSPRPPRKRAAMRPLDRSARIGLSQASGFLLFARPNTLPAVAANVVWAMVVDTVGTAGPPLYLRSDADPDSWTKTWDTNVAARRKQLWVGELQDKDFERFFAERKVPLVSFDWPLIQTLVDSARPAVGSLTTSKLSARAAQRPSVSFRVVEDPERDYLAREVCALLMKLRQRGGDANEPAVAKTAWKLCGLLCRLPCTKQAYERAAGGDRFAEPVERMWKTIDNTKAAAFMGRRWKEAHKRYWDPIRSALRKLIRLQEDESTCSKYEALIDRIGEVERNGEQLRVVCQTNAERAAVKAVLRDFGVDGNRVTVHTFGARSEYGPVGNVVTLLFGPPPPWRESILVGGEAGRIEVLCYRHELARLRARVESAERTHEEENTAALDQLRIGRHATCDPQYHQPQLHELPGYEFREADEPADEWSKDVPPADSTLWQDLLRQYGQELPEAEGTDAAEDSDATPAVPYSGFARLVRFTDAPPVFFRDDAEVDVLLDDEEADGPCIAVPVGQLETGMNVAFLPGGHRSIVGSLFDAYDERLSLEAKMFEFEPLWERAINAAIANVGLEALAASVGRTKFAVLDWRSRRSVPQQDWRFKMVLEASGDEEALRAQKPLWKYLTATRGPHRVIGRLNRAAIGEAARDDREQPHLHELERLVGRDLEDLYDQVEQVTVLSVSAPAAVPLSCCGQYLADDDPYLRSHA